VNKDLQLDQYVTRTATKRSMVKCGANVRMFEHLKCEEIWRNIAEVRPWLGYDQVSAS